VPISVPHVDGIRVPVPGDPFLLRHVVLDVNGTVALDGRLLPGVRERVSALRERARVVIASGDTFGTAAGIAADLDVELEPLSAQGQAEQKRALVERLGAAQAAVLGNGRNDALALEAARLALVVIGSEGASGAALRTADAVVASAPEAIDLLLHPMRLVATLRG
jgi:P-type E1-E2 ATPase